MRRVEEGEERRRASVLQDTMSIAVTDYGFFVQGELCGVWVKISKWHRSGAHFWWKMLALFWARKCARFILQGGKRYEASCFP